MQRAFTSLSRPFCSRTLSASANFVMSKRARSPDASSGSETLSTMTCPAGSLCQKLGNAVHCQTYTHPPVRTMSSSTTGQLTWHTVTPTFFVYRGDQRIASADAGVVAVDMDGTLITPKSGKKWPVDASDWKFLFGNCVSKLQQEARKGRRVVIVTNQNLKDATKRAQVRQKIEAVVRELQIDGIVVMMATGKDQYRKPGVGMWDYLLDECCAFDRRALDLSKCVFVGDAAGRVANWAGRGSKKDFSCSDRAFAANVGIDFMTPEQYFANQAPTSNWQWGKFDPRGLRASAVEVDSLTDRRHPLARFVGDGTQEVVVLSGSVASGKSELAALFTAHGYAHVSRDDLGTPKKCLDATKKALAAGQSVVIDNTNPNAAARKPYVQAAKDARVRVRSVHVDTPKDICMHLNTIRSWISDKHIPDVAMHTYWKHFERPHASEGFDEVSTCGPFVAVLRDERVKRVIFMRTG